MAGHSKWANIKHRKAAQDAKRGKIFTKLIREITTSARLGDADPANNPRLRAAVAAALTSNMTRDTINRAIARGASGGDGEQLETIVYEGYGPAGSAVMVECLTDNRNRTVAEVRHAFSKCGGNLGTDGSVAYLFTKKGVLTFVGADEDADGRRAGSRCRRRGDRRRWHHRGLHHPERLRHRAGRSGSAGFKPESAEVTMIPSTEAELDAGTAPKLMRLIDMLEDLDDVQEVYHNGSISDEIAATL
jgi:YebC/PmpR family DNA-binding regulatory protein